MFMPFCTQGETELVFKHVLVPFLLPCDVCPDRADGGCEVVLVGARQARLLEGLAPRGKGPRDISE